MENIQDQIKSELQKDFKNNLQEVDNFAKYIYKASELKKDGKYVNYWLRDNGKVRPCKSFTDLFKQVANEGLWFDGIHITLQSTGVTFDYVAYKNKMLIAYPETTIDIQLVYEGDETNFSKDNGIVNYTHNMKNPFTKKDSDIIGGYIIIKNKRGEFLITQTKTDFELAKSIAKGSFIWSKHYAAMCLKTLIKRGCKLHFSDIYDKIDIEDNKNNSFDKIEKEHNKELEDKKEEAFTKATEKYINN